MFNFYSNNNKKNKNFYLVLLPLINLFKIQFYILFSIADDAMADCGFLKFIDDTLKVSFLQTLNTMRKHRLFCDVVINVS